VVSADGTTKLLKIDAGAAKGLSCRIGFGINQVTPNGAYAKAQRIADITGETFSSDRYRFTVVIILCQSLPIDTLYSSAYPASETAAALSLATVTVKSLSILIIG
jgi:hypothetical protein